MSDVENNIKRLGRDQKIAELRNYFAGQGIAADLDHIAANRDVFSDAVLDAALLRIAGMSAGDNALMNKVTSIAKSVFGGTISPEQLTELQKQFYASLQR